MLAQAALSDESEQLLIVLQTAALRINVQSALLKDWVLLALIIVVCVPCTSVMKTFPFFLLPS